MDARRLLTVPQRIKGSVIIAHAMNDWDIPYTHSEVLFDAFVEPHLSLGSQPLELDWTTRVARRKEIVRSREVDRFGSVEEMEEEGRKVILVKTFAGGHDYLGVQEGVQDMIRTTFGLV